ncbi:polysaccharide pyruvyl transferase family protein [Marinobacter metalliresistant]|uniref:Polysaccharide pyruvyl transferase family protein n=1 Tax=Marinobacter metalliresistant TaxID=2961995 RepID=A0ABZ2W561_9GAMM
MGLFLRRAYKILFLPAWFIYDAFSVFLLHRFPLKYFDAVLNVGDQINPYLVSVISKRKPFNVKSQLLRHTVGLGSMFHMANRKSVIWGTGIISDRRCFRNKTNCQSVKAVRGHLTEEILIENGIIAPGSVVLGDPGLLMPMFYQPKSKKQYKIGIVPHYVDLNSPLIKEGEEGVVVIDVRQDPESFIDEISKCEFIVSSSMHGLILSDSYGIPNKWISFSDKITGGFFKYKDYYSTTSFPNESCIFISAIGDLRDLIDNIEKYATVKKYLYDENELIQSFPSF